MACSPKTILREYRFWVVDGKVVTGSLYKRGGKVLYDEKVEDEFVAYAQDRAREWAPQRAYVIDVALLPSDECRIIETNTFNAAGLYAADVAKIVGAIEDMTF